MTQKEITQEIKRLTAAIRYSAGSDQDGYADQLRLDMPNHFVNALVAAANSCHRLDTDAISANRTASQLLSTVIDHLPNIQENEIFRYGTMVEASCANILSHERETAQRGATRLPILIQQATELVEYAADDVTLTSALMRDYIDAIMRLALAEDAAAAARDAFERLRTAAFDNL